MSASRFLFRLASRQRDFEVLRSGDPKRIIKHYVRKGLYRALARNINRWTR